MTFGFAHLPQVTRSIASKHPSVIESAVQKTTSIGFLPLNGLSQATLGYVLCRSDRSNRPSFLTMHLAAWKVLRYPAFGTICAEPCLA